jgi:hypothetical protein
MSTWHDQAVATAIHKERSTKGTILSIVDRCKSNRIPMTCTHATIPRPSGPEGSDRAEDGDGCRAVSGSHVDDLVHPDGLCRGSRDNDDDQRVDDHYDDALSTGGARR